MKKATIYFCFLILFILVCVNWLRPIKLDTEKADPSDNAVVRIGFSQVETDNPWRTAQINSFREAILPDSMSLIYNEPKNFTIEQQINDLSKLIKQKVDYLVIVPREVKPLLPILEEAKAQHIPVILIGQNAEGIEPDNYVSIITTDYFKEGQICAQMLAKKYKGQDCNIVEIYGSVNSPMAQTRSKGFRSEIKQYSDMHIIDTIYGNFDRLTAQKAMENALIQSFNTKEHINAVFAHSDEDGLGALQAIKTAGLTPGKDITIVSINGVQDVCKAIIAGEYLGTVESNPKWGPIAISLIKQIERGAKPFPIVFIPYRIIDESNAYERFSTAY